MRALVRDVSPSFANALCAVPPDQPIDLELARHQHNEYNLTLLEAGLSVTFVAATDAPDCCFIEDTAVIASNVALITRPGAQERRDEVLATARALEGALQIVRMDAPATLDGGDVMRVGKTMFVGRSARTNQAGIDRLAEVFAPLGYRVVPVVMPAGVLHLKSVCAPLGDDRITLADGSIPRETFGDVQVLRVPVEETYAANCLAIGERAICAKGYPRTRDALAAAGFEPVELDTSEFRKADGALTCLSILL